MSKANRKPRLEEIPVTTGVLQTAHGQLQNVLSVAVSRSSTRQPADQIDLDRRNFVHLYERVEFYRNCIIRACLDKTRDWRRLGGVEAMKGRTMPKVSPVGSPARAFRFDDDDERLLAACCEAEKLSMSDVVRRAIRAYAKQLGVVETDGNVGVTSPWLVTRQAVKAFLGLAGKRLRGNVYSDYPAKLELQKMAIYCMSNRQKPKRLKSGMLEFVGPKPLRLRLVVLPPSANFHDKSGPPQLTDVLTRSEAIPKSSRGVTRRKK